MNSNILRTAAAALALTFAAAPAHAGFIEGEITMSADIGLIDGAGITSGLADAMGIDFIGDDFLVDAATGSFADAGIAQHDTGTYNDFMFNPLTGGAEIWSIGDFSFALNSIEILFQNSYALILMGEGIISADGFLDTNGTWTLTANGFGSVFNFSSSTQVPEPAMLGLIGLGGLIGFGLRRRRAR